MSVRNTEFLKIAVASICISQWKPSMSVQLNLNSDDFDANFKKTS